MSRTVNVVVLCEDRQQEAFLRRFLKRAGTTYRVLRVEVSPKGRGSGEQFVRERFAKELAYYRSRQHCVQQALIVMIDADRDSVPDRIEQLERAVEQHGQKRRQPNEHVAIFSPARNIETWFAYLDGLNVDEQQEYPRLERERDCQRHVEVLFQMCQQGRLREPAPPSLEAACTEYHRRLR